MIQTEWFFTFFSPHLPTYILCLALASAQGAGGALPSPQFLAEQLTLSQPGGRLCPPQYYKPSRIFRPCNGSAYIYTWLIVQLYIELGPPPPLSKKAIQKQSKNCHGSKEKLASFRQHTLFKLLMSCSEISFKKANYRYLPCQLVNISVSTESQYKNTCTLCCKSIRSSAFLWCKMPMFCRLVQKPSFLSNWKIDGRHKIFWLFRSKSL